MRANFNRVVVQTEQEPQTAGELIRFWRTRRGLSQLELSLDANVSTKHLRFGVSLLPIWSNLRRRGHPAASGVARAAAREPRSVASLGSVADRRIVRKLVPATTASTPGRTR